MINLNNQMSNYNWKSGASKLNINSQSGPFDRHTIYATDDKANYKGW